MEKNKIEKISSDITDAVMEKYFIEFHKCFEELSETYTPNIAISKAINESHPVLVKSICEKLPDKSS